MLPPDLILDRALLISFYAGFVFFFHHIQQFCNRSAGIGFSANFHCLGKFCCPTMPCGICGGNFFANNLCCGRIIPEINCLVAHENKIGQHSIGCLWLYEDNVAGKIDDARFAKMSKRYEQEQGENAKKIKALRLELKKDESKRMDIDDFLETVRRYTDATTITKRMVAELIDHIEVYHAEKQDGVTNQRVVIYYNCIGAFDVPDRRKIPEADIIMETRKGVALSYAPEQVAV